MSSRLPVASPAAVRTAVAGDLRADRWAVMAVVVVNGVAAAAGLAGPWFLGRIIDTIHAGGGGVLGRVDRLAFGALLFTVAQIVLTWAALKIGYRFGERTAARVRERFLRRTLALPPRVADHLPTGDLIARGSTDTSLVATTLRSAVPEVLVAVVHALFLIGAVLLVDLRLGLCGLVCLLGVAAAVRWYLRRARPVYLRVAATGAEMADAVASTAKGARTIELLALEERCTEVAEAAIEENRSARLAALRLRTVLFPWSDVALSLPVVAVLLIGGVLFARDLVTVGAVVTSAIYLRQLDGPLNTLMIWIEQLQGAGASYARVEGLADISTTELTTAVTARGDRIEVRNAHFSYTGARDVLRGIDLSVQPGERLAIVGTSGAGKSTLARLLAGLDRPHTGSVTVGGAPVADLPPDELREHVVLITQDHHVFHDSLRANLLIAKPSASDDDLRAALSAVGADWSYDLDAPAELDDAEAQQLSLARVVLADPHTVILDEATSLLDPTTARRTEQSLAAVLRGRTVIAIAHRLQTAHDADRIAVMEAGRLVELGTHADLVAANGPYGRLWHTWHRETRD